MMTLEDLVFLLSGLFSLSLAVGAALRRPRTLRLGSFSLGMLLLSASTLLALASLRASDLGQILFWERTRLVVLSSIPAAWLAFSLSYARGNSRAFLVKWKPLLLGACALPLLPAIGWGRAFTVDHRVWELGVRPLVDFGWPAKIVHLMVLGASILTVMNFERTFRAAVGTLRWRIKFAVLGFALLFAAHIYTSSQALVYSASDTTWGAYNAGALLVACGLISLSSLRASFSAVEVYPSLGVVQGSLTVLLAGLYLSVVGVLAKFVVLLGGDAAFPLKALLVLVAIVTLGLVLASDRVQFFLRRFSSRHFHRPFYDYRTLWRRFSERTGVIVEATDYARELANLVSEAVQSLSVSVWLLDEARGTVVLTASTSLPQSLLPDSSRLELDLGASAQELALRPEPIILEDAKEKWTDQLKELHPDQFQKGGTRVCVPLVGKEQLLGLLVVGDRVNGFPFSIEDFELFKSIASQAAFGLLNLQLSQQLVRAKEMEAFQTMAAFFVHDLKNTASSLSLMLQNLPAQMENPAFRQDALRAVSKAVDKLNDLISRLGALRYRDRTKRKRGDLNQVVRCALEGFAVPSSVRVIPALQPLPEISLDAEQVQKVVTNLLVNAREAVGNQGEITVQTAAEGSSAVLSVKDTGCGINPEFLKRSLFRPFQTTRKNGLGIGMFHCKTIVEAHQGRIEAQSQLGQGTTFRVLLPLDRVP